MMLYPPVPKMLESVPSRYLLVNVIARRARQVAIEAEEFKVPLEKKPVSQAIDEIAGEVPVLYSTTEKQIGKLSDNTPVYEKTVILTGADVPTSGTPKAISVEEGIKIYDIQGSLTFADEVTPLDFYLNTSFFSNCREVISDHALYISASFTGKTCTEARVTYTYTKPVVTTNTRKKK